MTSSCSPQRRRFSPGCRLGALAFCSVLLATQVTAENTKAIKAKAARIKKFVAETRSVNSNAVDAIKNSEEFLPDDLTPPSVSGSEGALAEFNSKLFDKSLGWRAVHRDSVTLECEGGVEFIGKQYNLAHGKTIDEKRCPLPCFFAARKQLHNIILKDLGIEKALHDCKGGSCSKPSGCGAGQPKLEIDFLYEAVLEKTTKKCANAPKVVLLLGTPAVGKDFLLKLKAQNILGSTYAVADADEIKTTLVEHGSDPPAELVKSLGKQVQEDTREQSELVKEHYDIGQILASYVHRESIMLSYVAMQSYMKDCKDFVIQKTGTSWSSIQPVYDEVKNHGYEVHILMACAHPWTIWLNHLHRVKHFKSAGRSMQRSQVITDSTKFPAAAEQMVTLVASDKVEIAGLTMLVYGDLADVASGKEVAQDVTACSDDECVKKLAATVWGKWGEEKAKYLTVLQSRREEYAAELAPPGAATPATDKSPPPPVAPPPPPGAAPASADKPGSAGTAPPGRGWGLGAVVVISMASVLVGSAVTAAIFVFARKKSQAAAAGDKQGQGSEMTTRPDSAAAQML